MLTRPRLTIVIGLLVAASAATPAQASTPEPDFRRLQRTVIAVIAERTGENRGRIEVQRRDGDWVFGVAVQVAKVHTGYPLGWLFLARTDGREWTAALDSTAGFGQLAAKAPEKVFSAAEKQVFANRGRVSTQALSGNTGLRLPYALGQTWTMVGGPHGWGGNHHPYSSLDLAGGDGIVRAAGGGTVYTMCADNSNGGTPGGWRRVYHPNGYTTDYYHLWYLTSVGSTVGEGAALGRIGKNICAGGSANGPHVHWGLLTGDTRVTWHWRSAGKWVFWETSAYHGYALHGSTIRYAGSGGSLYNYGRLGSQQGIIDTNGGGTVNLRSGPGTGYPVVGSVADGATVNISCWRYGTSHTGRWGTTSVWNKLTNGQWFSDAFAYTGANTVGPSC